MASQGLIEIACLPEPLDDGRLREIRAALDDDPVMRAKTDTSGGAVGADDVSRGGLFFRVWVDGKAAGFYVLHFIAEPHGHEAVITVAYGLGPLDLVANVLPLFERQCAACCAVRVVTMRRGLIRKLRAVGYVDVMPAGGGLLLRKALC
jgi:hypothetical protein